MTVDYDAWLDDPNAIRCVLVECDAEVNGIRTPRYFSDNIYEDQGIQYLPILITESLTIEESIKDKTKGFVGLGDVELNNLDGSIDSYLDDIWANRDIVVLHGDVRWPRSDFKVMYTGCMEDVDSKNVSKINIRLRDRLELLNINIPVKKIGGNRVNADTPYPLAFGELFNISPLLIDTVHFKYQCHDRSIKRIYAVRDAGIGRGWSNNLSSGRFSIWGQPNGTMTANIAGDNVGGYRPYVMDTIKRIVTEYGPYSIYDLDTTQLDTFQASNKQLIGIYSGPVRTNMLKFCREIAATLGATLLMTAAGKLQLLQVNLPPRTPPVVTLTDDDILNNTLSVAGRSEVAGAVKVGYRKNWTVQENINSNVECAPRDDVDNPTCDRYFIQYDAPLEEALFWYSHDAYNEALRRLSIRKVQRTTFRIECVSKHMDLPIGSIVKLKFDRFGLNNGKDGVVIYRKLSFSKSTVTLEVIT